MFVGLGTPLTGVAQGLMAALNLDMLASATLDQRITFTRADPAPAATRFNSSGLMETFGVNLLTYSEDQTNAAYTKNSGSVVGGFADPFGGSKAVEFTGSATDGSCVHINTTVSASTTYTFSVWLRVPSGTLGTRIQLANQVGATISAPVVNLTTTWTRYTVTAAMGAGDTAAQVSFGGFTTIGSGVKVQCFGFQLELGSTANAYSPTQGTSTSGPRFDYDPATPAGVTGGELAPAFSSWGLNSDWSVVGSTLVLTGTGALSAATPGAVGSIGAYYTITYTVQSVSGTGLALCYNNSQAVIRTITTPGTYTDTIQSDSVNVILFKRVSGVVNAVITSVSIKATAFTPRGLLIEESRTNLLTYSRDMTSAAWAKTDTTPARTQVGLDGVANSACLITEGTLGTASTRQTSAAITAGSTITASFVVKRGNTDIIQIIAADLTGTKGGNGWFNLATGAKLSVVSWGGGTGFTSSITPLGGGWYRCAVTAIPDGVYTQGMAWIASANADLSNTRVSGATYIVDCAQLEVGAFATSIIPTAAATVTRAADNPRMASTNFSAWYNQSAGTFVSEIYNVATSVDHRVFTVDDGTAGNYFGHRIAATNGLSTVYRIGASNYDASPGSLASVAVYKQATALANGDLAYSVNGSAVTTSAPTLITASEIWIGQNPMGGGGYLNGYIRRLTYYNTRLPNATLQSLTT